MAFTMTTRPFSCLALLLALREAQGLESSSVQVVSRRRALVSFGAVLSSAASGPNLFSPLLLPPAAWADENGAESSLVPTDATPVPADYFPFEERDRKSNKGSVIREDYWYMLGKTPPRQLTGPLRADNPEFNAFGSCESTAGGGNSCTYVSLKQRAPAYSKYASTIDYGAREYQKLGKLLESLSRNPTDEARWQEAASYVVTEAQSLPPGIIDAELKMVLFATAMTTSPNFPGPSKELLVARFYVNEANHARKCLSSAIAKQDIVACLQAWSFGKDSWNSFFQVVNRSIVPKVGEPFVPIE